MKINNRKVIAFITTLIVLVGLAVLTILFATDSWQYVCHWFILGITINAGLFISFNVFSKYIISKYFEPKLNGEGR